MSRFSFTSTPKSYPSPQDFSCFISWAALIQGFALTQVEDLALDLVELLKVALGPLMELVSPSRWHPFPLINQPHHSPWCHQQICWGCNQSNPCCISKEDLNNIGSSIPGIGIPWGIPLVTGFLWILSHLDTEPVTVILVHRTVHPSNHPPPSNLYLQLSSSKVMDQHIKGLTEIQVGDSCTSCPLVQPLHCRRPLN